MLCCILRERLTGNQFSVSDNVVELLESHLSKVLTNLTCKECEEVDDVMVVATEVRTQFRILCSHTHRTCIG